MSKYLSALTPYWLWALLSLPALGLVSELLAATTPKQIDGVMHGTGEFAARFLIISLLASPLMLLFKGWRGPRWLRKNRRYFGVAAFGYGALHLVAYVMKQGSLTKILGEATELEIWTGWVAFAIFLPLAATSFDAAIRALGPRWKNLQRATYGAAVLVLIHWAAQEDWRSITPALVHFGPLIGLELYRIWYWYLRPRKPRVVTAQ
ncbi:ferric reductase-like transmembrane domain-containing protein [Aliiroseovarius subalbicans]|uniref:sulfite oxidase heme-binding subunit YedZ n=1 Tax=Aliiroseovarius subalbicans TaxID=2925840 RepID=UPI001F5A9A85|nr:ferric reductase-like transmembrane domain-containing protein [Aliiroseovarius subalbicans]MCI2399511.1 ferric reductase-like transmembrane domain-containing protein [Aliiroseovarius subalbicans]